MPLSHDGPVLRWMPVVLTLAVLTGGCSSDEGDPAPAPEGEAPTATFGFTQLIPLEGTEHGLLRITNTSGEPLTIESVRIEWAGYPDGSPAPEDATLAPGQTLDLRFDLPPPACDPADGEGPVTGVVETDRGRISQHLEHTGAVFLKRLWRTQCDEALLERTVRLGYSQDWSVVGSGTDARALGALVLTRREGDARVAVTGVDGSVLHGLRLPGATTLEPGQASGEIPLEITPGNRCDEHARGQATAPFDFIALLEIDGQRLTVPLDVPLAAMDAATEALDVACAARGSSLGS
jgi:hypothetical protein